MIEKNAPRGPQLANLPGVTGRVAGALVAAGITTVEQVRTAGDRALLGIPGIGPATLQKIRDFLAGGPEGRPADEGD